MAEHADNQIGIDHRLLSLASEPLRLKALFILNERTASVSDVAAELSIDVREAARELERMHEAGLIEIVGEVLRSGAIEPRYKATVKVLWSDDEWAELGVAERRRLSTWIVGMVNADVSDALETGSFDARVDTHASRAVAAVDEQGWRELSRIHADALDAVLEAHAASAERLAESGETGVTVLSAMLCCELPENRRLPG